ncbi:DNA repair protein RecN [Rhodovibrionaceae bacterium A322]
MLVSLSIRNVVLIDRLDLTFSPGLGVLTGETGAGKSILLDSLGLALGARSESGLVRVGEDKAQVTASFELEENHPAYALLAAQDMELEEDLLVLRRVLGRDGRSRAYINDQPISIALLKSLGGTLVEIQGQFDQRGLLDSSSHRALLDAYGNLQDLSRTVARLFKAWKDAASREEEARRLLDQAREDEEYLRHAVDELNALDPQDEEEEDLARQRDVMMHAEKLIDALNSASRDLTGPGKTSAAASISSAQRALERVAEKADGKLDPVVETLDRAAAEVAEALNMLASVGSDLSHDSGRLEDLEERFFTLKDMARKYHVPSNKLGALRDEMAEKLATIDSGGEHLLKLAEATKAAKAGFLENARNLSKGRQAAASKLAQAVNAELPPLKLDRATIFVTVDQQEEEGWGLHGLDKSAFLITTNPGAKPGPLGKVASGGELSRFLLALKVVLAEVSPVATLIFDEVDAGVGGATAAAVGDRLARLAQRLQVLVVTHSPQVAAKGQHHWQVQKAAIDNSARTHVAPLDDQARREEVARMLSGAEITDAARAAADQLMGS